MVKVGKRRLVISVFPARRFLCSLAAQVPLRASVAQHAASLANGREDSEISHARCSVIKTSPTIRSSIRVEYFIKSSLYRSKLTLNLSVNNDASQQQPLAA